MAGKDITKSHDMEERRSRQRRHGECPSCGQKLFKVQGFLGKRKQIPLTIEGKVLEGKCLICTRVKDPYEDIPSTVMFEQEAGDHSEASSKITLDRRIRSGDGQESGSDDDDDDDDSFSSSYGGVMETFSTPVLSTVSPSLSLLKEQGEKPQGNSKAPSEQYPTQLVLNSPKQKTKTKPSFSPPFQPAARNDNQVNPVDHPTVLEKAEENQEPMRKDAETKEIILSSRIFESPSRALDFSVPKIFDDFEIPQSESKCIEEKNCSPQQGLKRQKAKPEEVVFDSAEGSEELSALPVSLASSSLADSDKESVTKQLERHQGEIHVDPSSLPTDTSAPFTRNLDGMRAEGFFEAESPKRQPRDENQPNKKPAEFKVQRGKSILVKLQDGDLFDVDGGMGGLLNRLYRYGPQDHDGALYALAGYVWEGGTKAKKEFVDSKGIMALSKAMWEDMSNEKVATAAAHTLLALTASTAEDSKYEYALSGESANGVIDALLITMESLRAYEALQQVGCQALCSLASNSSSNADFNDGTHSGACLAVLNAMDFHKHSPGVQEWGIRALFSQCVHSRNAVNNKITILCSTLDSGVTGLDILKRIIRSETPLRKGILEWTCELYWILSISSRIIDGQSETLPEMLQIIRHSHEDVETSLQLKEVVLGVIANLTTLAQNRASLDATDVILLMLETMLLNKDHSKIHFECCCTIANMASEPSFHEDIVLGAGAIPRLIGAIQAFPEDSLVPEAALRALIALSSASEAVMEDLCESATLAALLQYGRTNADTSSSLEVTVILFHLLASMSAASEVFEKRAYEADMLDTLEVLMATYMESEEVQRGISCLLRNLSIHEEKIDLLLQGKKIYLLVEAMENHQGSSIIQSNACCTLWNIGVTSKVGRQKIAETRAVDCIIAALQNHSKRMGLVEMAFSALWGITHDSSDLKQQLFDVDGGVVTVISIQKEYLTELGVLEKACGLLSSISASPRGAEAAFNAGGVENVVKAMRGNPSSRKLLQSCCHFLNNIIARFPDCVDEASMVVSTVVNAVKQCDCASSFRKEARSFLLTLKQNYHEHRNQQDDQGKKE